MKIKTISIAVCIVSIALLALPGCGGKPFHYNPPSEIPEGPGALSGEDGEFTLYDSKSDKGIKKSKAAGEIIPDSKEYREFQDFQEWKKSKQGAKEYQEFQEWKKWKEFKKWQENQ